MAVAIIGGMGKFVWGGYILVWWKADHEPRHVHVQTAGGRTLGRLNLATLRGLEGWTPSRQLAKVILELKKERNL